MLSCAWSAGEPPRVSAPLGPKDILVVVAEWNRAARSMMDGIHILEQVHQRGALVKVLDKLHLDLTPFGKGCWPCSGRSPRTSAIASSSGPMKAEPSLAGTVRGSGASRKLTEHQQKEGHRRLVRGESARRIARDFNVHHATVS
jgi:hypothetical protein